MNKIRITLFIRLPPSNVPNGIKLNIPRNKFKTPTLEIIFIKICSFDSLKLLTSNKKIDVMKHNKGLARDIFILPDAL